MSAARDALERAHRHLHWIRETVRVFEDTGELAGCEPWADLVTAARDAAAKAGAGYDRMAREVGAAAVSFDRAEAGRAAERAGVEAEIIERQHAEVVLARAAWRHHRKRLEGDLGAAFADLEASIERFAEEQKALEGLSDLLSDADFDAAAAILDATWAVAESALERRSSERPRLVATSAVWSAVEADVERVRAWTAEADRRSQRLFDAAGPASRHALEEARNRLASARRALGDAEVNLEDNLSDRRGASLLGRLVADCRADAEELTEQIDAALDSGALATLRAAQQALAEPAEELLDESDELSALFAALRGAPVLVAPAAPPASPEEFQDAAEPESPPEPPAATDEPGPGLEPEPAEDVVPEPSPATSGPPARPDTRVGDFDWDEILAEEPAGDGEPPRSVACEPLLRWAADVEASELPRAGFVAAEVRGWVKEHDDGLAQEDPSAVLEQAQMELSRGLLVAVSRLPDDARVWRASHARRQQLRRWAEDNRARGRHPGLVARAFDTDALLDQLDLELSTVGVEKQLPVLRSVWTRVTFSPSLLDGLLDELESAPAW